MPQPAPAANGVKERHPWPLAMRRQRLSCAEPRSLTQLSSALVGRSIRGSSRVFHDRPVSVQPSFEVLTQWFPVWSPCAHPAVPDRTPSPIAGVAKGLWKARAKPPDRAPAAAQAAVNAMGAAHL